MLIALILLSAMLGWALARLFVVKPRHINKSVRRSMDWLRSFGVLQWSMSESVSRQSGLDKPSEHDQEEKTLWSKDEVENNFGEDDWRSLAYHDFKDTILARTSGKPFPCVYATMGYRADSHRYVFLPCENTTAPSNVRILAAAIRGYLREAPQLGVNTSLVVLCAPPSSDTVSCATLKTVTDHNDDFWNLLRGLRIADTSAWPADIPQDTHDPRWTFCFAGEPLFPVCLTPAHSARWSRHAGVLTIAMQPKWVLDQLLGTPDKRAAAQGKVRKLLAQYDRVDISPDLTSYGEEGTSEVRQLCLKDHNETSECPYRDFDS